MADFGGTVRVGVTGAGPCAFRLTAAEAALSARLEPAALGNLAIDHSRFNSDLRGLGRVPRAAGAGHGQARRRRPAFHLSRAWPALARRLIHPRRLIVMAKDIDTGTTDLLAALDDGVLTLTMNRPEARNAMSGAMTAALAEQLAAAELDPAVRCIVLTGAGRGFCAGGDVKGMAASGDGTVGDNTIDGAIHRQRVNQRATAGQVVQDAQADHRRAARGGGRRGAVAGAGLRPADHGQHGDPDHGVRPRRLLRRLRRHLLPDPAGRLGQGARAVLPVRPRQRRRGAAPRPDQLGVRARRAGRQDAARSRCAWPRARPSPTGT